MLRGIRLGAIQGNVPELHHPSWPAEFQDLHKQIGPRRQVKRPLTARQREVLQLLTEGRTMKEAAEALILTSRTIAFHNYRIMEIHGLKTNAELIQLALNQRILGARHHAPHPHPSTRGSHRA